MPLDPVLRIKEVICMSLVSFVVTHVVHIVEDTNTSLVTAPLPLLPVVRLALPQSPRVTPLTVATPSRGGDPLACGGPVPAILYRRLEVFTITSWSW